MLSRRELSSSVVAGRLGGKTKMLRSKIMMLRAKTKIRALLHVFFRNTSRRHLFRTAPK